MVTNQNGENVSVYLGNSNGTFQPAANFGVGAPGPYAVTIADLNGDGKLDIATANLDGGAGVLLGNGDGTFKAAQTYAAGSGADSIALPDLKGDGAPDLVVTHSFRATVSVLLGKGDGTFQSPVSYMAGATPDGVAVGDFNGDGTADIAVTVNSTNKVGVFWRVRLRRISSPARIRWAATCIICNSRTTACLGITIMSRILYFITMIWAMKPSFSAQPLMSTCMILRAGTGGTPARRCFLICMILLCRLGSTISRTRSMRGITRPIPVTL